MADVSSQCILTFRTDKPEAEVGLFVGTEQIAYDTWYAHRELSLTLHQKIETMLTSHHKTIQDITAIVGYAGPGSFTGLRIGLTVANALAYSLHVPIVGVANEEQWLQRGLARLLAGENDVIVHPTYGAPVHITQQKK